MLIVIDNIIQGLTEIVKKVPLGTNMGLVKLLWMMLQGYLISSRGSVFRGLLLSGYGVEISRRCWGAMRYGKWEIKELIGEWEGYVEKEGNWKEKEHGGYKAVAIDLVAFWRPRLKGWCGKHFNSLAGRALPAVIMGIAVRVGELKDQRVPLLKKVLSSKPHHKTGKEIELELLKQVNAELKQDEVLVCDAGFRMADIQAVGLKRGIIRLAKNVTAQRNKVAPYKGKGRYPKRGEIVRPLARKHKGRLIQATRPDTQDQFDYHGRRVKVFSFYDLILTDRLPDPTHHSFHIYVFFDPFYNTPLLLASTFLIDPPVALALYQDRWPVEQVPLAAKHMVGAHRQFVFAVQSCLRLPQLVLLAGNILTYFAATLPPFSTAFWDRQPRSTPGRLRRLLAQISFPNDYPFEPQLRKKASVTDHLLKGIAAHRRTKTV